MKLTHQFALLLATLLVVSGLGGALVLMKLAKADAAQARAVGHAGEIILHANALDRQVREETSLILGFMQGSAPRENFERAELAFDETLSGMRELNARAGEQDANISEVLDWLEDAEADLLVVNSIQGQESVWTLVTAARGTETALSLSHDARTAAFADLMTRSWNESETHALERASVRNTEGRAPFLMYAPALATDRVAASVYAKAATAAHNDVAKALVGLSAQRAQEIANQSGDEAAAAFAKQLSAGPGTSAELAAAAATASAMPALENSSIDELLGLAASTITARDRSTAYFASTLSLQRHTGKLLSEGLLQLDLLTREILRLATERSDHLIHAADAERERVRLLVAATAAGAALPVGLVGVFAVVRLRRRLVEFDACAGAVSAGRFDSAPPAARGDDFDKLANAWGEMVEGLRRRDAELLENRAISLQNERMAALGSLLAGVAHEVNNPLAFIKSNEEMSMQDIDDMLADPEAKFTASARSQLQAVRDSIAANVDGIVRVEKINRALKGFGGPAREARELVDLNDVAEGVLIIAHNRLKNKHRIIRALGPLPLIHGSPQELGQVVLNLVINAAEASPVGGAIMVQTSAESGVVRLSVSDDGPGVSAAMQERLFQRFATSKANGTGLGLHISRNIAVAHGGTLDLDPSAKGGRFVMTIPVVDQANPIDRTKPMVTA